MSAEELVEQIWFLPAVIAAGVIVLAIVILAIATARKSGKKTQGQPGRTIPAGIEVYSGTCLKTDPILLKDGLKIGSGEDCELKFAAEDMPGNAAKLVLNGDQVCLSGLDEDVLTAVGGREFRGQRMIRSGDVLSVGEAEFMLRFPV